jgi:molybdopterin synthase sulfur carrier subunit
MPRVFIPPQLRSLTNDLTEVDITGTNVRQVIDALDAKHPGIRSRLCEGDELKPGLTVAIGRRMGTLGLLEKVDENSEVHFLPAIGGG